MHVYIPLQDIPDFYQVVVVWNLDLLHLWHSNGQNDLPSSYEFSSITLPVGLSSYMHASQENICWAIFFLPMMSTKPHGQVTFQPPGHTLVQATGTLSRNLNHYLRFYKLKPMAIWPVMQGNLWCITCFLWLHVVDREQSSLDGDLMSFHPQGHSPLHPLL